MRNLRYFANGVAVLLPGIVALEVVAIDHHKDTVGLLVAGLCNVVYWFTRDAE